MLAGLLLSLLPLQDPLPAQEAAVVHIRGRIEVSSPAEELAVRLEDLEPGPPGGPGAPWQRRQVSRPASDGSFQFTIARSERQRGLRFRVLVCLDGNADEVESEQLLCKSPSFSLSEPTDVDLGRVVIQPFVAIQASVEWPRRWDENFRPHWGLQSEDISRGDPPKEQFPFPWNWPRKDQTTISLCTTVKSVWIGKRMTLSVDSQGFTLSAMPSRELHPGINDFGRLELLDLGSLTLHVAGLPQAEPLDGWHVYVARATTQLPSYWWRSWDWNHLELHLREDGLTEIPMLPVGNYQICFSYLTRHSNDEQVIQQSVEVVAGQTASVEIEALDARPRCYLRVDGVPDEQLRRANISIRNSAGREMYRRGFERERCYLPDGTSFDPSTELQLQLLPFPVVDRDRGCAYFVVHSWLPDIMSGEPYTIPLLSTAIEWPQDAYPDANHVDITLDPEFLATPAGRIWPETMTVPWHGDTGLKLLGLPPGRHRFVFLDDDGQEIGAEERLLQ